MEELLKCKDLTNNKRVIAAYWALKKRTYWPHRWQGAWTQGNYPVSNDCECYKCLLLKRDWTEKDDCKVPDPIPGSLADIAFAMRDACDANIWIEKLIDLITERDMRGGIDGRTTYWKALKISTKNEWIIAATLAWEGSPRNENSTEK